MASRHRKPAETRVLRGFSDLLDQRLLEFLQPIHGDLICDVCGLVSPSPVRRKCQHVYCFGCNKYGLEGTAPNCLLDGEPCEPQTGRLAIPWALQTVTNNDIRCPNSRHGCQFIASPSTASREFPTALKFLEAHYRQCGYHQVACETCKRPVVLQEVVGHLRGGCGSANPASGTHEEAAPAHLKEVV